MILGDLSQTQQLAQKLAGDSSNRIFALVGDLGSGKTTFVQFFLRALGIQTSITSPTFLIIKSYVLQASHFKRAYHIDCCRLKNSTELLNLDFSNIINNEENVVLIEWAEKVRDLLSEGALWLNFKHGQNENERIVDIGL